MPPHIGVIGAPDLVLRKIAGQQRLQLGQAERLLERANHDQIGDMHAVVALFARLRQKPGADVVVDGGRRDGLGLLELGRQIVKVLPQKQHDLLHVQPEIRDLLPRGQAIGGEILFPAPQLAYDKVIVEFHKLTHTFRNQYSTSRAKCNEYLYWKTN